MLKKPAATPPQHSSGDQIHICVSPDPPVVDSRLGAGNFISLSGPTKAVTTFVHAKFRNLAHRNPMEQLVPTAGPSARYRQTYDGIVPTRPKYLARDVSCQRDSGLRGCVDSRLATQTRPCGSLIQRDFHAV